METFPRRVKNKKTQEQSKVHEKCLKVKMTQDARPNLKREREKEREKKNNHTSPWTRCMLLPLHFTLLFLSREEEDLKPPHQGATEGQLETAPLAFFF